MPSSSLPYLGAGSDKLGFGLGLRCRLYRRRGLVKDIIERRIQLLVGAAFEVYSRPLW
jgi:hypothetical protein